MDVLGLNKWEIRTASRLVLGKGLGDNKRRLILKYLILIVDEILQQYPEL